MLVGSRAAMAGSVELRTEQKVVGRGERVRSWGGGVFVAAPRGKGYWGGPGGQGRQCGPFGGVAGRPGGAHYRKRRSDDLEVSGPSPRMELVLDPTPRVPLNFGCSRYYVTSLLYFRGISMAASFPAMTTGVRLIRFSRRRYYLLHRPALHHRWRRKGEG